MVHKVPIQQYSNIVNNLKEKKMNAYRKFPRLDKLNDPHT